MVNLNINPDMVDMSDNFSIEGNFRLFRYGFMDPFKWNTWIALLIAMFIFYLIIINIWNENFFNAFGYIINSITAMGENSK